MARMISTFLMCIFLQNRRRGQQLCFTFLKTEEDKSPLRKVPKERFILQVQRLPVLTRLLLPVFPFPGFGLRKGHPRSTLVICEDAELAASSEQSLDSVSSTSGLTEIYHPQF